MALTTYPSGVKIYLDDVDVTNWLFNVDELALDDFNNSFEDIDITSLIPNPGRHKIEIRCDSGVGRAEVRLEID